MTMAHCQAHFLGCPSVRIRRTGSALTSEIVYKSSVAVLRGQTLNPCIIVAVMRDGVQITSLGIDYVFFCRFRVPAPVVLVDGVLDREALAGAFSSFCTSSMARFCHTCM